MKKIPEYTCPVKHVKIGQGQFSQHSHKEFKELNVDDSYAVDFLVPEGTLIYAAADGVVVFVKDDSNKNYSGKNFEKGLEADKHANLIVLKHDDGTFTTYIHIKQHGSKVKIGEKVKEGQEIALSGNTGWSTQPHLHFSRFTIKDKKWKVKSLPYKFKNYKGSLKHKDL